VTVSGRVEADVERESLPGRGPVAVGENPTWIVQLVAAARDPPGEGQLLEEE
jgi:hypothetical protein